MFYPRIDLQMMDELLNDSQAGYIFAFMSFALLIVSAFILIHNLNDR